MSDNKILAVVTGASRGIGAAIADRLAEDGFHVVGTATSDSGASKIGQRLGSSGTGLQLDVTAETSRQAFLEATAEIGAPQVLVNNAGITRDQLLLRMKEEDWDAIMQTNLKSVFLLSKAFLRGMMKARAGRIINIASVIGVTGNAGQANYAAAKAGIIAFGKSMAQEVGSRNITVNTIAPGLVETDMVSDMTDAQREAMLQRIPLARAGRPEDIAAAVSFLASAAADYITGETLHVNGGMYMP